MFTVRLLLVLGIVAVGPAGVVRGQEAGKQGPAAEMAWPPPPETARVKWVGALRNEAELGRKESFFARLKRSLAGVSLSGMFTISRPYDVWAADDRRVFITDGITPAVIVFDREAKQARFLGEGVPGGLKKPMGLTGTQAGQVLVADQVGRRVVVFDQAGRYLRSFGGPDVMLNPIDVAVDEASGRYYVVDSYLHQILVYDERGHLVERIGRRDGDASSRLAAAAPRAHGDVPANGGGSEAAASEASVPGHPAGHGGPLRSETRDVLDNRGESDAEFKYPVAAAVGPDGTLWVVDQLNFRVQAFSRDGRFLSRFGRVGTTPGSFARPKGIAVDSEGHVFVVDAAFNNVQIFDPDGRLLLAFSGGGSNQGYLQLPMGISIGAGNRVYVADRYNNRISMFEYLPVADRGPGER
jgi:sugar lactone lactonase YvrE